MPSARVGRLPRIRRQDLQVAVGAQGEQSVLRAETRGASTWLRSDPQPLLEVRNRSRQVRRRMHEVVNHATFSLTRTNHTLVTHTNAVPGKLTNGRIWLAIRARSYRCAGSAWARQR